MDWLCLEGWSTVATLCDSAGQSGEDLPQEGLQDGQERPQAAQEGPAQAGQVYSRGGSG